MKDRATRTSKTIKASALEDMIEAKKVCHCAMWPNTSIWHKEDVPFISGHPNILPPLVAPMPRVIPKVAITVIVSTSPMIRAFPLVFSKSNLIHLEFACLISNIIADKEVNFSSVDPRGVEPRTPPCHGDVLPLYHGPSDIEL